MVNRVYTVVYWFPYPIFTLLPSPDEERAGRAGNQGHREKNYRVCTEKEVCRQVEAARTEGV
jgi:hypothetical protein